MATRQNVVGSRGERPMRRLPSPSPASSAQHLHVVGDNACLNQLDRPLSEEKRCTSTVAHHVTQTSFQATKGYGETSQAPITVAYVPYVRAGEPHLYLLGHCREC
jgi:hypothetical protein